MFQTLTHTVAPGSPVAAMAPGLDWQLVLRTGPEDHAVTIRDGAVMQVTQGPFVMPSWHTRISASVEEWRAFLVPVPKPGHHDIIALLRRGAVQFDGDLHPLMAHLMYVKRMFETLRVAE
ncbi:hypothetical protein [Pseudooceanicola onchidii]|uniref:hypothetical protein n=1 Tax=Pseudooceanicola onchidii TaxID=2562279 RepID=UPI0010AB3DFD|nr:hypothetical protein [Pseudooceanicola onchidii]